MPEKWEETDLRALLHIHNISICYRYLTSSWVQNPNIWFFCKTKKDFIVSRCSFPEVNSTSRKWGWKIEAKQNNGVKNNASQYHFSITMLLKKKPPVRPCVWCLGFIYSQLGLHQCISASVHQCIRYVINEPSKHCDEGDDDLIIWCMFHLYFSCLTQ